MDRLSHYELLEQLGEGGMGIVYKARDTRLDRFVAVKVLSAGKASDPERRRRFVQEAKAASALDHPNVITVHEIASEGGVDFIVTEYVPGRTLARTIPPTGLAPPEALRYAVQIADALAATHAAGVIHRDLKPANVMVTEDGRVKVLDFGLAKLLEPRPSAEDEETQALVTREGAVVGTCAYMSPEQAQGHAVDPRTDVFSFGAVLYEMVTGRKAFARPSASATLVAVLGEEPEPPGELVRGVPAELERVIHRCLRKDSGKRFQSMADLRVALEELREESAAGPPARAAAWSRRPWVLAGAATLLATAAIGTWLAGRRSPEAAEPTRPVPLTNFAGQVLGPAISPDGNQFAFVWDGASQDSFDLYVKLVGPGDPVRLTSESGTESSPAWSPDGRQIAFFRGLASGRNALVVIPALGGAERVVTDGGLFDPGPSWAPDGLSLVVPWRESPKSPAALVRVSLATGKATPLTRPPPDFTLGDVSPAFSPDGRTLAFARALNSLSSEVFLLPLTESLDPASEPVRLTTEGRSSSQPAWTPDGRRIVFTVGGYLWFTAPYLMVIPTSAKPGEKARRLLGGEGGQLPSFSRTGSLVFSRSQRDVNIWRLPLARGRPGRPSPLVASTRLDMEPRFSPDARRIAFLSDRSGSAQVWLAEADGSRPVQLTDIAAVVTSGARWSPDGRRIVFLSNPGGDMDLYLTTPNGGQPQQLTRSPAHDSAPSWSRDGAWIYFASNREDGFQVWKTRPEPGAVPVRVTRGGGYAALESTDGRTVFFAKAPARGRWAVWKVPSGGGEETEVIPRILNWGDFDVTATGIYYAAPGAPRPQLRLLRFADGSDTPLAPLERRPRFGIAAAPDDSAVLYTSFDVDVTELMLIERFR